MANKERKEIAVKLQSGEREDKQLAASKEQASSRCRMPSSLNSDNGFDSVPLWRRPMAWNLVFAGEIESIVIEIEGSSLESSLKY